MDITPSAQPELVAHRFSLWTRLQTGAAAFDASGRLLTLQLDGRFLRRGLDNSLLELTRDPGGPWPWKFTRLQPWPELYPRLAAELRRMTPEDNRGKLLLERALAGLEDGYVNDAAEARRVIGPVPIVPPNHSRCVVLRLTEGCQYNACRFCTLYADDRFRVRPPDEFAAHVDQALAYFGEGAGSRPSLWVGDASGLEAGADGFAEALRLLRRSVRVLEPEQTAGPARKYVDEDPLVFEGIYAFADVPRAARLRQAEAERLARLGVRRLYLGVESGHQPLLRRLAKPHTPALVREAVRNLHAAGIAAGVILLVGAGGDAFVEPHERDTAQLVEQLELGEQDFLFLSPLDARSRGERHPIAGDEPLDDARLARAVKSLRAALRRAVAGRRLRIADYQLDGFVY